MKAKLKIIIPILLASILTAVGIVGYKYYQSEKIRESKEHFKKAEALYKEAKYDDAIKEYSMIHKWDEENYKLKSEKISMCETNRESLEYIETAKKCEQEYDYTKAIELYQKVSETDNIYYADAQNSAGRLKRLLEEAEFILKYIKSIEIKFGFKNKDIEKLYFSRESGFIADQEVAVTYKGKNDRLYIVTEKKPFESYYTTTYKIREVPKYITVFGEVQRETGWLSYSINSLRETTARTMIEGFSAIDTKADDELLNYVQHHE